MRWGVDLPAPWLEQEIAALALLRARYPEGPAMNDDEVAILSRLRAIYPKMRRSAEVDFSTALDGLKDGRRYMRAGWNGKGMFIFLVPGSTFRVNREPLLSILGEGATIQYAAHIDIMTEPGKIAVWSPTQVDLQATDWLEVRP